LVTFIENQVDLSPIGEFTLSSLLSPKPLESTAQLGAAIRKRRKEAGLSLVLAAASCAVSVKFLQALETGKPTVQFDKALAVSRHFGVELLIA
jgi:HTH-type transcriptional regulator / antitoxin HipB